MLFLSIIQQKRRNLFFSFEINHNTTNYKRKRTLKAKTIALIKKAKFN